MSVTCGYSQGRLIGPGRGIGVAWVLPRTIMTVAEIPLIAAYSLSTGVGGGGAGKLCGVANTYASSIEVGCRLGINNDLGGSSGAFVTNGGCASIGTRHGHGAVGTAWAETGGSVSTRSCPAVGSPRLLVDGQVDRLSNAIWAVVVHNAWKNATVGGASAFCLGKGNRTMLL